VTFSATIDAVAFAALPSRRCEPRQPTTSSRS
jgi:hypothetical protein